MLLLRILSVTLALTFSTVGGDLVPILPEKAVETNAERDCKCIPFAVCYGSTNTHSEDPIVTEKSVIDEKCDNPLEVCCKSIPSGEPPVPRVENVTEFKECGFRLSNEHGSGKSVSKFEEFPWMVAITSEILEQKDDKQGIQNPTEPVYEYKCGGSLVHPKVVITGAHCVFDKTKYQLKVRAGNSDGESRFYQERRVSEVIEHEDYENDTRHNDIAVLILDEPITPADNVGLVCLPLKGILPDPANKCLASVWLKNSNGNIADIPSVLEKEELLVVESEKCQNELRNITKFGHRFRLHDSLFCAENQNKMNLIKDGGIPLVCPLIENPGRYIQSGISAQLLEHDDPFFPEVFVNVANFREWIDKIMEERKLDSSSYSY